MTEFLQFCFFLLDMSSENLIILCLDIKARQTTSGVYAITVTTSAYHSRR